jgi:hypothetical protein
VCDPGLILGIGTGVAQVAGQRQAADSNIKMIRRQAALENAAHTQELLVQTNAANKDAYNAQMEADAAASTVKAKGEGMAGSTAGAQIAEQQRQGALSIANAKDRADGAKANYASAGHITATTANNDIDRQRQAVSPLKMFSTIAASGLSSYGMFK